MSAPETEDALYKSLAAVMTLAEQMIDQLAKIAAVYDAMPQSVKERVAKAQVEEKLGRPL